MYAILKLYQGFDGNWRYQLRQNCMKTYEVSYFLKTTFNLDNGKK